MSPTQKQALILKSVWIINSISNVFFISWHNIQYKHIFILFMHYFREYGGSHRLRWSLTLSSQKGGSHRIKPRRVWQDIRLGVRASQCCHRGPSVPVSHLDTKYACVTLSRRVTLVTEAHRCRVKPPPLCARVYRGVQCGLQNTVNTATHPQKFCAMKKSRYQIDVDPRGIEPRNTSVSLNCRCPHQRKGPHRGLLAQEPSDLLFKGKSESVA